MASVYTAKDLTREARAAVKGLGRFDGYEIVIHETERVTLRAYFIRHYNPHRPKAQQAREWQGVAI